jgi:hypothetical protein
MSTQSDINKSLSSQLHIPYPEVSTLPEDVRKKFENLPTVVNIRNRVGTTRYNGKQYRSGCD